MSPLYVRSSYLALLYGSVVLVTHGTDLHAFIPLPISLCKKLPHDTVRPPSVQLQRFCWVAQVSTMDNVLQNLRKK